MTQELTPLAKRIKELADEKDLSIRKAGQLAGGIALIQNIMVGKSKSPRAENLEAIADVLGTTTSWLLKGEGPRLAADASPVPMPTVRPNASGSSFQEFNSDIRIPLRGQTIGGPNGRFLLNGEDVGTVFCPPGLEGVEGAYAVAIFGTSMEPAYSEGDTVWLNPHATIRANDDVVVQVQGEDLEVPESYIKRFISRSSRILRLRQFNPEDGEDEVLEFPYESVVSIHKVVFHARA